MPMNDKINTLLTTMTNFDLQVDALYDSLSAEESSLDKELVDLYHYIEFGRFSASEGYKAMKMVQDCLRKRRDVKNSRAVLSSIKSRHLLDAPITGINDIISRCEEEKTYTPRIRGDLFKEDLFRANKANPVISEDVMTSKSLNILNPSKPSKYGCNIYDVSTNNCLYQSRSYKDVVSWIVSQNPNEHLKPSTINRYLQRMRKKIRENKPATCEYHGYRFEWGL